MVLFATAGQAGALELWDWDPQLAQASHKLLDELARKHIGYIHLCFEHVLALSTQAEQQQDFLPDVAQQVEPRS